MSGDEWLPGTLWGVQIARLHKVGSLFVQEQLRPYGLGTGLHPYLLALEAGPLHQEGLSEALSVDKANTARAVAKLEVMGLVVRRGQGTDKRLKVVELTGQGKNLLPTVKLVLLAWEAKLRAGMAQEQLGQVDRWLGLGFIIEAQELRLEPFQTELVPLRETRH